MSQVCEIIRGASASRSLIGVSIPRSGHGFLCRLIVGYYGSKNLHYCEFYTPRNCCKAVPCSRLGYAITFQKNHDRDFALNRELMDALYVVQYRQPVPEALSDYELAVQDTASRICFEYRKTTEHQIAWLAEKAIYYRRFHNKWMRNALPNAVYLNYDDLVSNPEDAIEPIISWASGEFSRTRFEPVIERERYRRSGRGPNSPEMFTPRTLETSAFFEPDLLGAFEDYVLRNTPKMPFHRQLSGKYQGTTFHGLVLLKDTEEPLPPRFADRLEAASNFASGHPEIGLSRARQARRENNAEEAIAVIEGVLEQYPYFTPAYSLLFEICSKAQKPLPAYALSANALLASLANPDLLIALGIAYLTEQRFTYAVAALSTAATLAPDSYRANYLLATVLAESRRPHLALGAALRAAPLGTPDNAAAKLANQLQKRLGQR